ncbi:MAG: DUF3500 domain-containing protein [Bacteroidota bacterium]
MKLLLSVVSLSLFVSCTFAQTPQHTYLKSALDFQYSVSPLRQQTCFLALNDSNRFTWSRLPGDRPGLKLSQMNEEQKLFFHRMLRAFFPSTGYLKITAIMFNEDIQKKNEPELGKNEYWLLFFGELGEDSEWGWKLEGHHLSINIMLKGNELLAFTPMILATNPAVTNGDGERDGMVLLYEEEELGRKLLHSLSANQLEKAYSEGPKPNHPLGEDFQNLTDMPQEGILYSALTDAQKQNFPPTDRRISRHFLDRRGAHYGRDIDG